MWLPRPLQLMLYLLLSTSYSLGVNSNCNICWPLGNTIIKSNTSSTGNTGSTGVADGDAEP